MVFDKELYYEQFRVDFCFYINDFKMYFMVYGFIEVFMNK